MQNTTINTDELFAPFERVQKKPIYSNRNGERRLVAEVSYITARQVMDRLDRVFGVLNWTAEFRVIADRTILCRITVTLPDGTKVSKEDIGFSNNDNDSDNGLKGAASDALKRAAVHFGIGRYLYGEGDDDQWNGGGGGTQQKYIPRSQQVNTQPRRSYGPPPNQPPPFGSEEEESYYASPVARLNALRAKHRWTDAQFRDAFGVNYSNAVIEQMIADGMTPEEINDTVLRGG